MIYVDAKTVSEIARLLAEATRELRDVSGLKLAAFPVTDQQTRRQVLNALSSLTGFAVEDSDVVYVHMSADKTYTWPPSDLQVQVRE